MWTVGEEPEGQAVGQAGTLHPGDGAGSGTGAGSRTGTGRGRDIYYIYKSFKSSTMGRLKTPKSSTMAVFPGGSDLMNTSRISDLLGQEGPKTVFIGPV